MREKTMKGLICYTKEAGLYAVNKKSIKHVKQKSAIINPFKETNFESIIRNGLKREVTAKVWGKGEKGVHGEQDERPDLGHAAEVTSRIVVNMTQREREERGKRGEQRER